VSNLAYYLNLDAEARKCRGGWQGSYPGGCYRKGQIKGAKATPASRLSVANKIRQNKGMKPLPAGSNESKRGQVTGTPVPAPSPGGGLARIANSIKASRGGDNGAAGGPQSPKRASDRFLSNKPSSAAVRDWIKAATAEAVDPSNAERLVKEDLFSTDSANFEKEGARRSYRSLSPEQNFKRRFADQTQHRKSLGGVYKPEHTGMMALGVKQSDVDKAEKSAANAAKRLAEGKTTKDKAAKTQAQYEKIKQRFEKNVSDAKKISDRWNEQLDQGEAGYVKEGMAGFNKRKAEKAKDLEVLSTLVAQGRKRATEAATDLLFDDLTETPGQEMARVDYTSTKDPVLQANVLRDAARATMVHRFGQSKAAEDFMGLKGEVTREKLKTAYRRKAAETHPDRGGSREEFEATRSTYEALKRRYNFDAADFRYTSAADYIKAARR
jgi:hypothetical protein